MKIFRFIILGLIVVFSHQDLYAQISWFGRKAAKTVILRESAEKAGKEVLEKSLIKGTSKAIIYEGSYKAAINNTDNVVSKQFLKKKAAIESSEAIAKIAQNKTSVSTLKSLSKASSKKVTNVVAKKSIAITDDVIKESIKLNGAKPLATKTLTKGSSLELLESRLGKTGAQEWSKLYQGGIDDTYISRSTQLLKDIESFPKFGKAITKDPTLLKSYNNAIESSLRTDIGTLRYIRNGADNYSAIKSSFRSKWGVGDDLIFRDEGNTTKIFNKNNDLLGVIRQNDKYGYDITCSPGNRTLINLHPMKSSTYHCDGHTFITDKFGRVQRVEFEIPHNVKTAPRDGSTIASIRDMKNNYNAIGGATRRNGISTDEGGHLIPLQAGGTNDIINIIPQSRKVNRGSGSLWYNGEKAATKAAVRGDNVKVIVDIEYDKAGFSMRPTSFKRTQYVNGEYQTVKGKVYNKLHMDNTQEFLN